MVKSIKPEDQFGHWRSEYEADIFVSLASLAGERMFFEGDSTSGVSGDLESATVVASQMEAYFGMGSTVSSLSAAHAFDTGTPGGGGPRGGGSGSDAENARLRLADRIENSLAAHLEKTARMLRENRREVLVLAHALETHKTMTGDDVAAVVEGRPGPTIDGTPYNDPDFVSQIEVFHHAAVNRSPSRMAVSPSRCQRHQSPARRRNGERPARRSSRWPPVTQRPWGTGATAVLRLAPAADKPQTAPRTPCHPRPHPTSS